MTTVGRGSLGADVKTKGFFAEPLHDYTVRCPGGPVTVLQAGCLAPLWELGIDELAEGGFEISVTAVDADHPLAKRALEDVRTGYDDVIVGDLRTVPIARRAYDIVYCAGLLERVEHVELVLDRLVSALKPGGLLLIRARTGTPRRPCSTGCCRDPRARPCGRACARAHPGRSRRFTRRRSATRKSPPTR
jgi:SAM-dependent methyltransferase